MKIYTSYFAQLRNFPSNLVGLSTAVWNPKWLNPGRDKSGAIWLDCPPFKPGKECSGLCNGKCAPKHPNDCNFLQVYRKQLDRLDCNMIISKLEVLANKIMEAEDLPNIDFAFLVYETPQNACSERRVIQEWFHANGVEIEEWSYLKNV